MGGWVLFWQQNPYIYCARQFFFRALCAGLEKICLFWLVCQVWFQHFCIFGLVFQKPGGIEIWAKHTSQALVFTVLKPWGILTAMFTSQIVLPSCVWCLGPCKFGIVASHWLPWSNHLCLLLKVFDQFANFESKLQHFGAEQILANMVHGKFPGAQRKWCWGQAAGGGPCGKPDIFLWYFYNKLIGPCQEKIFYTRKKSKMAPARGKFLGFSIPNLGLSVKPGCLDC